MLKSRPYLVGLIFVAILVVFLVLRFSSPEDTWICQNGQWVKHGNPSAPMPKTPCGTGQLNLNQNNVNQNVNQAVEEKNITIASPTPDTEISSPVEVSGLARVFENQLNVRLKNQKNQVLAEKSVYANSPDTGQFGPYQVSLDYQNPGTEIGIIEAFDYSAKDGSEIDKVIVPVKFKDYNKLTVKVFFPNNRKDPQALDCQSVFSVDRVIDKTEAVARAAVEQLLQGPTPAEKASGYFSSINDGVKIKSLVINNGIAKIDFDKKIEDKLGGSCRVSAIRSQISQTLKQFPTVKEVIISVEGNVEEALQP
jgi:hypothetical protein